MYSVRILCEPLCSAWDIIIQYFKQIHGLRRAAKMLRKFARVSQYFAAEARHHPDNNVPPVRERVCFHL